MNIAIVGYGKMGRMIERAAAERGHAVTLIEQDAEIGGQFRYAREVPGKEEFRETLRYFNARLRTLGVDVRFNTLATHDLLESEAFDEIIVAAGVVNREGRQKPGLSRVQHAW